jgi:phage-related protein (TIGR01555 family)
MVTKIVKRKFDSYINKLKNIGTKSDVDCVDFKLLSIDTIKTIYAADGIAKKIIDIKSEDMIREWIEIEGDTDGKILNALHKLKAKSEFLKAIQYNKIFGGSIIFMLIDDGGESQDELNKDNIKSIKKIKAYQRERFNVLSYDDVGEPLVFEINRRDEATLRVHASRCLVFQGDLCLDEYSIFQNMEYWGISEIQSIFNILGKLGLSLQSIFDMLIKSNLDVLKVDGLWDRLRINNEEGEKELDKRLEKFDQAKSLNNTLMLDKTEDYETISQNYSGVPDVIDRLKEFISLISGIAVTILWGTSTKGLNSTGDNDVRRYYDSIKNDQELTIRSPLSNLIELITLAKDLSITQEVYNFDFKSLWQLSEKEEAEIKKITAETDQIYINNAVLDPSEVRQARFGGEKYSSDILVEGDIEIDNQQENDQSNT